MTITTGISKISKVEVRKHGFF